MPATDHYPGTLGIGELSWRILRRVALAGGSASWAACRPWTRKDERLLIQLEAAGLVKVLGPGVRVHLTDRGRQVQELGLVTVEELDALNATKKPALKLAEAP